MTCSIENCEKPIDTRGWCRMHYARWQRHGDPLMAKVIHGDDIARFHRYVDKTDTCWLWVGTANDSGYPKFKVGGRMTYAHRWSYTQAKGAIPQGLQIDHLCRTPLCVNPAHLEAVTPQENVRRSFASRAGGGR